MHTFSEFGYKVTYEVAVYKLVSMPTGPCYFDEISNEFVFDSQEAAGRLSCSVLMMATAVDVNELPAIYDGKKYHPLYTVCWKVKNRNIRFDLPDGKVRFSAEELVKRYGEKMVRNMCKWSSAFRVYALRKLYCMDTDEILDPEAQGMGVLELPESAPENYAELQAGWKRLDELLRRAAEEAGLELAIHLDRSFDLLVGDAWVSYPDLGCDPDAYEGELWGLADYFVRSGAMAFEEFGREVMDQLVLFGQVIVDGCPDIVPID